jgi:hypothetical protein
VPGEKIVEFLREYNWADGKKPLTLEIEYIEMMLKENKLRSWLVLLPQTNSGKTFKLPNTKLYDLSIVVRARVSNSRFKVYSEPRHRDAASFLSGVIEVYNPSQSILKYKNNSPTLLMYFVNEGGATKSEITVGFGIQYPGQKVDKPITWMVVDQTNKDAVVIRK